ncbi:MAG: C25 family cysteine peptidase [Candidatus Delongbacteria bacterium]|jgi:hypothetical protein|nr:C25 family cysteine peptidase [Candidatus Delongbacteria bacterium]
MKMRNYHALILAFVIMLSAANVAVLDDSKATGYNIRENADEYLEVSFSLSKLMYEEIETERGTFTKLEIERGYLTTEEGSPALPAMHELIAMPLGSEPSVEVISYEKKIYSLKELGIKNQVYPAQPSYSKSSKPEERVFVYNEDAYTTSGLKGEEIASVSKSGTMRGVGVGLLRVKPFRYDPVAGTIEVLNDIKLRVNFIGADPNAKEIAAESYSPYFESAYGRLINYKPLDTKADLMTYPVTYLILANSNLNGNADLNRFIEWKTQKGFKVVTNYVSASSAISTNDAWIESQWNSLSPKPSFLLVIGDHDGTYGILSEVNPSLGSTGSVTRSDLLYQVIGATSSSNRIPSIYAGRMSVRSTTELKAQVDKTIWYEKEQFTTSADLTYLTRPLGAAGVDSGFGESHGDPQITYGWMHYFTSANGMTGAQYYLYPESGSADASIVSFISNGANFYNYTAHGSETSFGDPSFTITSVNSLANAGEYPLVVGNCCLTGSFGTTECFGESWLNAENKGAVGYIGASMSTYWDEDLAMGVGLAAKNQQPPPLDTAHPGMYDGVMALGYSSQAATRHVGLMAVEALGTTYVDDYWCAYQMFGDPSVQIYFGIPSTMTVSHSGTINEGATSYNISGAAPYAYIALSDQNGVLHGAARANSSGSATITVTSYSGGDTGKMVITAQFKKPYFADITVGGGSTEPPSAPALASPSNGSSTYDLTPTFDWSDASGATSYTIQADNNSAFTSPEISQTVTSSTYTPSSNMALGTYYWRVRATNTYGSSSYTSAWTLTIEEVQAATLPFYENFNVSTSLPSGWEIIDNQGSGQVWQFGTFASGISGADGNYAYLNSDGYGSGNTQNCDLITPVINMTGASNVTLAFSHYFRSYSGSSGTLSYSINGGSSWTQIQQWTADTTNPVAFSQVISAVAGQSQVKFKWNYTGTWGYYWSVDDLSITTEDPLDPPAATTLAAGSITTSGAVLNGTVNANGETTTVTFEYGITTGYGSSISAAPGTVTGTTNTSVSATLSGLAESTTYNFRVKAVSAGGTVYGSNQTFTTEQTVQPVDPPTALAAQVSGADVSLSWTAPESGVEPDTFTDGFESYADFALTFANWTQIDGDGIASYGSNEADFTNENYTGAFIIFNPSAATPALTGVWAPRTGSKYAACFAAQTPPNNDWLISPQLNIGAGYNLSLYARSLNSTYGLDRFKVGVSTTGTAQGDFTIISAGSYLEAPTAWTNYSYDLSAYAGQAVYIAIVCVSNDSFVFMLDDVTVNNAKGEVVYAQDFEEADISYTREKFVGKDSPRADLDSQPKETKSTLSGYKVYRNGSAIATITNPATVTYTDLGLTNGSYSYYVSATYADPVQESDPSNTANAEVSVSFVIDTYPWAEGFEGTTFVPDHWTLQSVSANTWTQTTGYTVGESTIVAAEGTKFGYVNYHSTDAQNEWLITPEFDLSAISSPELSFYFHGSYEWTVTNPNCMLKVMQRVDGGSWTEIWRATDNPNFNVEHTIYTWFGQSLTLTGYSKGVVQLAFVYTGTDGAKFAVDDILIQGGDLEDPRDFAVASANGVEVTLGWNFVEGATYYNLYRSTDPYGTFALIGSTAEISFVDNPPSAENMHFYYLTAANDAKTVQAKPVIPVPAEVPNSDKK